MQFQKSNVPNLKKKTLEKLKNKLNFDPYKNKQ